MLAAPVVKSGTSTRLLPRVVKIMIWNSMYIFYFFFFEKTEGKMWCSLMPFFFCKHIYLQDAYEVMFPFVGKINNCNMMVVKQSLLSFYAVNTSRLADM